MDLNQDPLPSFYKTIRAIFSKEYHRAWDSCIVQIWNQRWNGYLIEGRDQTV